MSVNSVKKKKDEEEKKKANGSANAAAQAYIDGANAGFSKDTITAHLHNIGYTANNIQKGQAKLGSDFELQGGERGFDWDSYIYDYGKKTADSTRQKVAGEYFNSYNSALNKALDEEYRRIYGGTVNGAGIEAGNGVNKWSTGADALGDSVRTNYLGNLIGQNANAFIASNKDGEENVYGNANVRKGSATNFGNFVDPKTGKFRPELVDKDGNVKADAIAGRGLYYKDENGHINFSNYYDALDLKNAISATLNHHNTYNNVQLIKKYFPNVKINDVDSMRMLSDYMKVLDNDINGWNLGEFSEDEKKGLNKVWGDIKSANFSRNNEDLRNQRNADFNKFFEDNMSDEEKEEAKASKEEENENYQAMLDEYYSALENAYEAGQGDIGAGFFKNYSPDAENYDPIAEAVYRTGRGAYNSLEGMGKSVLAGAELAAAAGQGIYNLATGSDSNGLVDFVTSGTRPFAENFLSLASNGAQAEAERMSQLASEHLGSTYGTNNAYDMIMGGFEGAGGMLPQIIFGASKAGDVLTNSVKDVALKSTIGANKYDKLTKISNFLNRAVQTYSTNVPAQSLTMMGANVFGNEYYEGIKNGGRIDQAAAAAMASAAVEIATENIGEGNPFLDDKSYGKVGKAVENAINNICKTDNGRALVMACYDTLGEGFEEYVSAIAGEYIAELYKDDGIFALPAKDALKKGADIFLSSQDKALQDGIVGIVTSAMLNVSSGNTIETYKQQLEAERMGLSDNENINYNFSPEDFAQNYLDYNQDEIPSLKTSDYLTDLYNDSTRANEELKNTEKNGSTEYIKDRKFLDDKYLPAIDNAKALETVAEQKAKAERMPVEVSKMSKESVSKYDEDTKTFIKAMANTLSIDEFVQDPRVKNALNRLDGRLDSDGFKNSELRNFYNEYRDGSEVSESYLEDYNKSTDEILADAVQNMSEEEFKNSKYIRSIMSEKGKYNSNSLENFYKKYKEKYLEEEKTSAKSNTDDSIDSESEVFDRYGESEEQAEEKDETLPKTAHNVYNGFTSMPESVETKTKDENGNTVTKTVDIDTNRKAKSAGKKEAHRIVESEKEKTKRAKEEAKKEIAKIKADANTAIKEANAEAKKKIAQIKADSQKEVSENRAESKKEIAQVKANAKKEIAETKAQSKAEARKAISEIKEKSKSALAEQKASYQEKMKALNAAHKEAMAKEVTKRKELKVKELNRTISKLQKYMKMIAKSRGLTIKGFTDEGTPFFDMPSHIDKVLKTNSESVPSLEKNEPIPSSKKGTKLTEEQVKTRDENISMLDEPIEINGLLWNGESSKRNSGQRYTSRAIEIRYQERAGTTKLDAIFKTKKVGRIYVKDNGTIYYDLGENKGISVDSVKEAIDQINSKFESELDLLAVQEQQEIDRLAKKEKLDEFNELKKERKKIEEKYNKAIEKASETSNKLKTFVGSIVTSFKNENVSGIQNTRKKLIELAENHKYSKSDNNYNDSQKDQTVKFINKFFDGIMSQKLNDSELNETVNDFAEQLGEKLNMLADESYIDSLNVRMARELADFDSKNNFNEEVERELEGESYYATVEPKFNDVNAGIPTEEDTLESYDDSSSTGEWEEGDSEYDEIDGEDATDYSKEEKEFLSKNGFFDDNVDFDIVGSILYETEDGDPIGIIKQTSDGKFYAKSYNSIGEELPFKSGFVTFGGAKKFLSNPYKKSSVNLSSSEKKAAHEQINEKFKATSNTGTTFFETTKERNDRVSKEKAEEAKKDKLAENEANGIESDELDYLGSGSEYDSLSSTSRNEEAEFAGGITNEMYYTPKDSNGNEVSEDVILNDKKAIGKELRKAGINYGKENNSTVSRIVWSIKDRIGEKAKRNARNSGVSRIYEVWSTKQNVSDARRVQSALNNPAYTGLKSTVKKESVESFKQFNADRGRNYAVEVGNKSKTTYMFSPAEVKSGTATEAVINMGKFLGIEVIPCNGSVSMYKDGVSKTYQNTIAGLNSTSDSGNVIFINANASEALNAAFGVKTLTHELLHSSLGKMNLPKPIAKSLDVIRSSLADDSIASKDVLTSLTDSNAFKEAYQMSAIGEYSISERAEEFLAYSANAMFDDTYENCVKNIEYSANELFGEGTAKANSVIDAYKTVLSMSYASMYGGRLNYSGERANTTGVGRATSNNMMVSGDVEITKKTKSIVDHRKSIQSQYEEVKSKLKNARLLKSFVEGYTEVASKELLQFVDDDVRAVVEAGDDVRKLEVAEERLNNRLRQAMKAENARSVELSNRVAKTFKAIGGIVLNERSSRYLPPTVKSVLADVFNDGSFFETNEIDSEGNVRPTKSNMKAAKAVAEYLRNNADNEYSAKDGVDSTLVQMSANSLKEFINGRHINELSAEELDELAQRVDSLRGLIKDVKDIRIGEEKYEIRKTSQRLITEAKDAKAKGYLGEFQEKFAVDFISSLKRLGSYNKNSFAYTMSDAVEKAHESAKDTFMRLHQKIDEVTTSNEDKAAYKKFRSAKDADMVDIGLKDKNGNTVKLTRAELVSVVMTAQDKGSNAFNRDMLFTNRKALKDFTGLSDRMANKVNVGRLTADNFNRALDFVESDEYCSKFMEASRAMLNDASKYVNDYSRKTLYKEIANNALYFPTRTESDFNPLGTNSQTLFNRTMMQERENGTSNMVMLPVDNVLDSYMKVVSDVVNIAPVMSNINKLFNASTVEGNTFSTIKSILGEEAVGNVAKYMQLEEGAYNGPTSSYEKFFNRVRSNAVSAALNSNLGVTIGQIPSIFAANKYVNVGAKHLSAVFSSKAKMADIYNEIDEHAGGSHYARRAGLTYRNLGSVGLSETSNSITHMDVRTTAAIWLAVKDDITAKTGETSGAKYWNEVSDVYNKILRETQPQYDAINRNLIYHSGFVGRMTQAFTSQSARYLNGLNVAYGEYQYAKKMATEIGDAKSKSEFESAKKHLSRTITSTATAQIMYCVMRAAIKNLFKDKDDEEQFITTFGNYGASSIANLILPGTGNIGELLFKKLSGQEVSRYSTNLFSDIGISTFTDFGTAVINVFDSKSPDDFVVKAYKLAKVYSRILGVPYDNVRKIVKGTMKMATKVIDQNNEFAKFDRLGVLGDNKVTELIASELGLESEKPSIPSLFDIYENGDDKDKSKAIDLLYNSSLNKKGELKTDGLYDDLYELFGTEKYDGAKEMLTDLLEYNYNNSGKSKKEIDSLIDGIDKKIETSVNSRVKSDVEKYNSDDVTKKEKKEIESKLIPYLGDMSGDISGVSTKYVSSYTKTLNKYMDSSQFASFCDKFDESKEKYSGEGKSKKIYQMFVSTLAQNGVKEKDMSRAEWVSLCKTFGISESMYKRSYD